MIKLIIFDLDGTLLDTIEDLANATNHALKQFNFPLHDTASYRFFVGNGINKLIERALPEEHKNADCGCDRAEGIAGPVRGVSRNLHGS